MKKIRKDMKAILRSCGIISNKSLEIKAKQFILIKIKLPAH